MTGGRVKESSPLSLPSLIRTLHSRMYHKGILRSCASQSFLTLKTFFLLDSSLAQCSCAPLKSTLLSGRLFPGFCFQLTSKHTQNNSLWHFLNIQFGCLLHSICRPQLLDPNFHTHNTGSKSVWPGLWTEELMCVISLLGPMRRKWKADIAQWSEISSCVISCVKSFRSLGNRRESADLGKLLFSNY